MRLLWLDEYTLHDPVALEVGDDTGDQIDDAFVQEGDVYDSGDGWIAAVATGPVGPTPYAGNAYYTPIYGSEDFYTPWGRDSLDSGLAFLKTSAGAIAIIAFLIFVMPFAVSVVGTLIEEIRKEFRR